MNLDLLPDNITDEIQSNTNPYAEEIRKLAEESFSADPARRQAIHSRLLELEQLSKDGGHPSSLNLYTKYASIGAAASAKGSSTTREYKQVMGEIATGTVILDALKAGTGIVQAVRGHFKQKKLTPPKFPKRLGKSKLLSTRINQAMVQANNGDEQLKTFFKENLNSNISAATAAARATGNVGSFAANVQGINANSNEAMSNFLRELNQSRTQGRAELDGLIGQDIAEDARINRDGLNRYSLQRREFDNASVAVQSQINSGLNNLFTGLDGLGQSVPLARSARRNRDTGGGGIPIDSNLGAPIDGLGQTSTTNQAPSPQRPLNMFEFMRLGQNGSAESNNPAIIGQFQQLAIDNNLLDPSSVEEFGVFDEATRAAYESFYFNQTLK